MQFFFADCHNIYSKHCSHVFFFNRKTMPEILNMLFFFSIKEQMIFLSFNHQLQMLHYINNITLLLPLFCLLYFAKFSLKSYAEERKNGVFVNIWCFQLPLFYIWMLHVLFRMWRKWERLWRQLATRTIHC